MNGNFQFLILVFVIGLILYSIPTLIYFLIKWKFTKYTLIYPLFTSLGLSVTSTIHFIISITNMDVGLAIIAFIPIILILIFSIHFVIWLIILIILLLLDPIKRLRKQHI